ncbi:MAG: Dyp-type peroxidase [Kineosporiaceae bacterium]
MSADAPGDAEPSGGATRRALLLGGGALGVAGAATATWAAARTGTGDADDAATSGPRAGAQAPPGASATVAFHGRHQPGVTTLPAQSHAHFVALDLRRGSTRADLLRLMRLLTDDAARLMEGRSPLAADEPELAGLPSRLTVTVGFGAGVFDLLERGADCPPVVRDMPAFATDRLEERWSGGDVLLQVCADDPVPVSFAIRRLVRDAREVATVRWSQRGFGPARGSEPFGTTPRNLMGQRDGSANPRPGAEADAVVWAGEQAPDWYRDGTTLVLRRIRMDLDTWDDLDRFTKEIAIGRRLSDGTPLTGGDEFAVPDPTATGADGLPVLDPKTHAVLARHRDASERMLRRGYSYDDGPGPDGRVDAGLLFAAFQPDAAAAFVAVQRRLAAADALNTWTTHVGSAAFVIPPGCAPGEVLGQSLIGARA